MVTYHISVLLFYLRGECYVLTRNYFDTSWILLGCIHLPLREAVLISEWYIGFRRHCPAMSGSTVALWSGHSVSVFDSVSDDLKHPPCRIDA